LRWRTRKIRHADEVTTLGKSAGFTVTGKDGHALQRQLDRLERKLPDPIARCVHWVRQPASRWMRIPAGVLLIAGGIFSFLPVLGLWMLPLGLLLLAQDLPFLRRPMRLSLVWAERRWRRRRRNARSRQS
jgi:hypothetical protein